MHIDLYKIVKGRGHPYPLAVGGGHTKQPYNHEKRLLGVTKAASVFFNFYIVFYFLSTDLNAFDFRSVHPAGVQTIYFSLPSPHIPIAALAANRVIIIVINITFYLKTIILTKF